MQCKPTFRPIVQWPGRPTRARVPSRFKAGFSATLDLLDRELWHLRAKNVVIEAAVHEGAIRNDGGLRADARLQHPGIILSFDSRHGPLRYPCDTYTDWRDNLRAIALALEALRTVDRYGVTKVGEQYTGWKQLPGPAADIPSMSTEDAARLVGALDPPLCDVHELLRDPGLYRRAYRLRAAQLHPDHNGGDAAEFKRLQEARRVLDAHHAQEGAPCQT